MFGLHSRKVTRTSPDKEGAKVEVESSARLENVSDATTAVFGALQLKAESGFQVLEIAVSKCCFAKDSTFIELEDLEELESRAALHLNVNLVLADFPYNTCSARGRANFPHIASCKKDIEDAVHFKSNVMTPGAQGHIFCSAMMFFHWNKSFLWQMRRIANVEPNSRRSKERGSNFFQTE